MRYLLPLALVLVAVPAAADPTPKTIGIDGGLALPTGTWGDGAGVGIGGLARFEMPLQPALVLTVRAGYIQHLAKDQQSTDPFGGGTTASTTASEIPVLGGVRYAFSKAATSEIYGAAELGFVVARVSVDYMSMSNSDSNTNLGMALAGGYRSGGFDVRAGLFFPDLGHVGDAMAIMATVGFDVAKL